MLKKSVKNIIINVYCIKDEIYKYITNWLLNYIPILLWCFIKTNVFYKIDYNRETYNNIITSINKRNLRYQIIYILTVTKTFSQLKYFCEKLDIRIISFQFLKEGYIYTNTISIQDEKEIITNKSYKFNTIKLIAIPECRIGKM